MSLNTFIYNLTERLSVNIALHKYCELLCEAGIIFPTKHSDVMSFVADNLGGGNLYRHIDL